eukprot:CAMPEP_0118941950 /NCGR_PEP_ID=MMETSP1169-20130426/35038_1 /TAXON_ID=36882 /ORGANISM="Pyramimonas obovata, Strain CCMP722" /LENGTH=267 /DNA_ID=CAMNT_0006886849 /DNA_START=314 /DNA_END=1113 /DNA_ORIENTATION=-
MGFQEDAAYKASTLEETQEVERMGEQIDLCVSLVGSSLNVLMRALDDFEHWRDMVSSQQVLPTNVLSYLTVIASQVLRGKTQLADSIADLRAACSAAAPKKLIRDFAVLTQDMKFAKQQSMLMERKARVAEAKAHALDNRIPLHWFRLAHKLAERKLRRQMQARVNYARAQQGKLQKQLTDSIKAREQAANKARDKAMKNSKHGGPRTLQDWYEISEERRHREKEEAIKRANRIPGAITAWPIGANPPVPRLKLESVNGATAPAGGA